MVVRERPTGNRLTRQTNPASSAIWSCQPGRALLPPLKTSSSEAPASRNNQRGTMETANGREGTRIQKQIFASIGVHSRFMNSRLRLCGSLASKDVYRTGTPARHFIPVCTRRARVPVLPGRISLGEASCTAIGELDTPQFHTARRFSNDRQNSLHNFPP
jgi:hypothetical protein